MARREETPIKGKLKSYLSEAGIGIGFVLLIGLIGAGSGFATYIIYKAFDIKLTLGPGLVDEIIGLITMTAVEASVIGGLTFIFGAIVIHWKEDEIDEKNSSFSDLIMGLGMATFIGLIGIPTSLISHIIWTYNSTDFTDPIDLILTSISELTGTLFDLLFVGFVSPIAFTMFILMILLIRFLSQKIEEYRDKLTSG